MTSTPYSSLAVANWFVENVSPIDPLKLQKLAYFSYGWHLVIQNEPLFDELIQAWEYGPIVPGIYDSFKEFGKLNIPQGTFATSLELSNGRISKITPHIPLEDEFTQGFLEKIKNVFGSYSGLQLSAMAHQTNTPWYSTRQQYPNRKNIVIPDDDIKFHFNRIANQQIKE
jgi:uncharacterized phage-associated protein